VQPGAAQPAGSGSGSVAGGATAAIASGADGDGTATSGGGGGGSVFSNVGGLVWTLIARDEADKRAWIAALRGAINAFHKHKVR
jgi:hypothetical protein